MKGSTSLTGSLRVVADAGWLKAQVVGLFAAFPPSAHQTPEAYAARVLAYIEDLAEYPQDIIVEAIREARRNAQTFCPSIKDIRDIASRVRRERYGRNTGPKELPDPVRPDSICTPEQAAEILARIRGASDINRHAAIERVTNRSEGT